MARKRRRGSDKSGVLLGHLVELVLKDGRTMNASALRGKFLGWMPSSQDFAIVTKAKAKPAALSPKAKKVFREFHNHSNPKTSTYEWPEATGLRQVGRVKSLTYVVPEWVKSPQKRGYRWVHEFGDHGERGHGEHTGFKGYSVRLMPMLMRASNGSLHIRRMPGNKYDVTSWIYW